MKLREKILLLSGLALTSCAYLLYFASSRMFLENFKKLEEREADHSARQAMQALDERLDGLLATDTDWAQWDESYDFMENQNDHYKASNLNSAQIGGLRLNLIAYVNQAGEPAYSTGYDYIAKRFRPVPTDADQPVLHSRDLLTRCMAGDGVRGLIATAEGPMMIAAHAIVPSDGNGPPRGMLVMGRFLDVREMTDLRRVSRQTLNLFSLDDPLIASELGAARVVDAMDPPVRVGAPGENVMSGYGIIHDIFGKPVLTLRTVMPRDILSEGRRTVNTFLVILMVSGLLATITVAWLFDRLVLSPLARLRSDVAWTAARGVLSGRVPVTGRDEIAMTAQEINRLLDTIEQIHLRARDRATRHGTEPAVNHPQ